MKNRPLATRLRQLRTLHNYSQQEIADELNVVRQTYSHYETGRNYPNAETLYKLSNIYSVPINSLLDLTIDEPIDFNQQNTLDIFDSVSDYFNDSNFRNKKIAELNITEKELLFFFNKINIEEQKDILNFIRSRALNNT